MPAGPRMLAPQTVHSIAALLREPLDRVSIQAGGHRADRAMDGPRPKGR